MRKLFVLMLLAPLFFRSAAQAPSFHVVIVQEGREIIPQNHVVKLKRAPFVLAFTLSNLEGVYLNACESPLYFDLPDSAPIPEFQFLNEKVMAEPNFNADKDLIPGQDNFHYLFYDPEMNWHRFDPSISREGNVLHALRTVAGLYDADAGKTLPLEKIRNPLYLLILAANGERNQGGLHEIMREKIKIEWQ